MPSWKLSLGLLSAVAVLAWSAPAAGQPPADDRVPPDKAIVEFDIPDGAALTVDGDPIKARKLMYPDCDPRRLDTIEVRVKLKDGTVVRRSVSFQGGWRVRVPLGVAPPKAPEVVPQTGHSDALFGVAVSPDGRHLATAAGDRVAILWDAKTGRKLRTFPVSSQWVVAVAFSPDGKRLLTGSKDALAMIWDVETGRRLTVLRGHAAPVWSVAFSPTGDHALTGSEDNTAALWDARTGEKVRTFQGHALMVWSAVFSPKGDRVLTGSADGTAAVWDARSGERLRVLRGHAQRVLAAAFHPDGRRVLTGSQDATAIVWDADRGEKLHTLKGHTDWVRAAAFSPDGKTALLGSFDGTASAWDADAGKKLGTFGDGSERVMGAAFTPDGTQAVTASWARMATLWSVPDGRKVRDFQSRTDRVSALTVSPNGKLALIGLGDGTALLWAPQAAPRYRLLKGHTAMVIGADFHPDGKHAVTASKDGTVIVWDTQTAEKVRAIKAHDNAWVTTVRVSADGGRLLTASTDQTAAVWDFPTGKKLHALAGHKGKVWSADFSPDGGLVVTAAEDNTAAVWDARSGQKLRAFTGHGNWVLAVRFHPSGRQVLSLGLDRTAFLWDVQTAQKVRAYAGHDDIAAVAVFRPGGKQFVTASHDNTLALWDTATAEKRRALVGHTAPADVLAIDPAGRYLLSASDDGTAGFWDLATGDRLASLIFLDKGEQWLVVTPEGFFDGSAGGRQNVNFRVGGGLDVVPVDRFFQDFYRPGLLAALWGGRRVRPQAELGATRAPLVKILSPAGDGAAAAGRVKLAIEVTDQGGGITGPWLIHNGARLAPTDETSKKGKTLRCTFTVDLVAGDNQLVVQAASADGSWESEPAGRALRWAADRPDAPVLHLVAIGINRYAREQLNLDYARKDADELVTLFRRRGGPLYRDVKVHKLLDEEATLAGITDTLAAVAREAAPQDIFVLFLAGHGYVSDDEYYFVPHEFRRRPGKSTKEDVTAQGLSSRALGKQMLAVRALRRLVIFDTCHSGAALTSVAAAAPVFELGGEIEKLSRNRGVFAIAAAASAEESKEEPDLGHGVFTYALLAAVRGVERGPLRERAIQPRGDQPVVNVNQWFDFVTEQYPRLMLRYFGREQQAVVSSSGLTFPVLPALTPANP